MLFNIPTKKKTPQKMTKSKKLPNKALSLQKPRAQH